MLAVSEGDPGTGWALTLGAHHVLTIGAWFSEAGQRDIFGTSGEFQGPAPGPAVRYRRAGPTAATWSAAPGTTARGARTPPTSWANAMVAGTTDRITAVLPIDQVTVLDDWGDGGNDWA